MALFGLLYLVFAIIFGVHFGKWDDTVKGQCYNTRGLALPDAHHPYVDKIYLGTVSFYMFVLLLFTLNLAVSRCKVDPAWGKRRSTLARVVISISKYYAQLYDRSSQFIPLGSRADQQGLQSIVWYPLKIQTAMAQANPVLFLAMLQLPLHLYFIIRLRLSNESLLAYGSEERQWGFGQIYALIMSAGLVLECCKGYLSAYIYSMICICHKLVLMIVKQGIGTQKDISNV
jgi:hypothetical protein